jgi:membrane protein DedA with SNARE-associated domain
MFDTLTQSLLSWAQTVPLELFAFIASFIEEVLAPIPSPIVMTVTGSIAAAQKEPMLYLIILSLIAASGKTVGAVLVYLIADKAENVLVGRFGRFIGVDHAEIEALGKRLNGGWKDLWTLLFLRALPIMSSMVVSVCCGFVKIPMRVYLVSTFIGTIIRDFFYLYVGFTGIETLQHLVDGFDSVESLLQAAFAVVIVIVIGSIYWKRKGRKRK